jgi:hypothetical protein
MDYSRYNGHIPASEWHIEADEDGVDIYLHGERVEDPPYAYYRNSYASMRIRRCQAALPTGRLIADAPLLLERCKALEEQLEKAIRGEL